MNLSTTPNNRLTAALATLAALLSSAAAHAQPSNGDGPPPAKVIFDEARIVHVDIRRDVIGQLRAPAMSRTAAQEPGRVEHVLIDPGDRVSQGQPIVKLDTTLLELDLRRLRAERASLNATLEERQANTDFLTRDLARIESLRQRNSATERELDQARTDTRAARARVAETHAQITRTEAQIASLEERIEDMTIRAPFDGGVIEKNTEVGEWVAAGDVVAQLARLDKIDVYVNVPESYINALYEPNTTVQITVDALQQTFESDDLAIISMGDELARTFPLRIRLDNPDQRMKPNMSVTASVPTGASGQRLTVSKDALLRNDAGPYLFIEQNGTAQPRQVQILFAAQGDRLAIREGTVPPGTKTIVVGNERLRPGQPLVNIEGDIPQQAPNDPSAPPDEPNTATNNDTAKTPTNHRQTTAQAAGANTP